jgi:putative flippase GtrA
MNILSKQRYSYYKKKYNKQRNFLIVGFLNTVFGLLAFPILFYFFNPHFPHYLYILFLSTATCILFSFTTLKYFVFKTKGPIINEFVKFLIFQLIVFIVNLIALPLLVNYLINDPIISQTIFLIFVILSSYFWHNRVTFKSQ